MDPFFNRYTWTALMIWIAQKCLRSTRYTGLGAGRDDILERLDEYGDFARSMVRSVWRDDDIWGRWEL